MRPFRAWSRSYADQRDRLGSTKVILDCRRLLCAAGHAPRGHSGEPAPRGRAGSERGPTTPSRLDTFWESPIAGLTARIRENEEALCGLQHHYSETYDKEESTA